MLLNEFALPCLSLLEIISKGGVDYINCKAFIGKGKDVVLLWW